jgi:hypothetical protein
MPMFIRPGVQLQVVTTAAVENLTLDQLLYGLQDEENADQFKTPARPTLVDMQKERVYNAELDAFSTQFFVGVRAQEDADMLLGVSYLMVPESMRFGVEIHIPVSFRLPVQDEGCRQLWGVIGSQLEALKNIIKELTGMGAIEESNMYVLPWYLKDSKEYSGMHDKLQELIDGLSVDGPLDPAARSLLRCRPVVDLEDLAQRVKMLNKMRLEKVVLLRGLQLNALGHGISFRIPGFDA